MMDYLILVALQDQEGQIDVFLGHWDKAKHLQWLEEHPSKKPKEVGSRK